MDDAWKTPSYIFEDANKTHNFQLDACAVQNSALCEKWYGPDHPDESRRDAFTHDWHLEATSIWMAPPYGEAIPRWLEKASIEASKGATIVSLIPTVKHESWWDTYVVPNEHRIIYDRLKFLSAVDDRFFILSMYGACTLLTIRPK